ncbi:MAG: hypothetical protein ABI651_06930 [Verrucomicrobiota bacterium]
MKTFTTVLLYNIVLAAVAGDQIRLVRHGKDVTERPSAVFTTNVVKLLQSFSVYSTAYAVKAETWREMIHSDSFASVTFTAPKKLTVMVATGTGPRFREEKSIDQILVPLPEGTWPGHIFAKTGTNILSFTKYDPVALKRVAFEPVLHLPSVAPYAALAKIEQPNK